MGVLTWPARYDNSSLTCKILKYDFSHSLIAALMPLDGGELAKVLCTLEWLVLEAAMHTLKCSIPVDWRASVRSVLSNTWVLHHHCFLYLLGLIMNNDQMVDLDDG